MGFGISADECQSGEYFRHPKAVSTLLAELREGFAPSSTQGKWARIMEVCGGQTRTILKYGLEDQLIDRLQFLHGPGCPVCVTDAAKVDDAITLSLEPGVAVFTYGDMMRVPGSQLGKGPVSLGEAKALGASVYSVSSSLEVLQFASEHPDLLAVFFAVGFETTAPSHALLVQHARKQGLKNLRLLVSHVRVPPVLRFLLEAPDHGIDGLLAPGHVCAIMGTEEYVEVAQEFQIPIVITGFEPVDLLLGVREVLQMIGAQAAGVRNAYGRVVRPNGNPAARELMETVFAPCLANWRGLGSIPGSGLALRREYADFSIENDFSELCRSSSALSRSAPVVGGLHQEEETSCQAGKVLLGRLSPVDCPMFGKECLPESPRGAPMVSSEGACAAYYILNPGGINGH